jgi:hypothetical protein
MGEGRCPADPISPKMSPTCENLSGSDDDITAIETGTAVSHAAAPRKPSRFRAPPPERVKVPVRQGWRDKGRELVFSPFPRFRFFEV